MEFRILGTLEVRADGREVPVGGGTQRALLAVLLLHPNQTVSSDRLIDEIWGDSPPATAAKIVQNHVSRLRKVLQADEPEAVLETHGRGYLIRVAPGALDADLFEDLVARGRRELAGDPGRASELLAQALALWRGPALADFAYESFAQQEISRLEERRLLAAESRFDAELALGHHEELISELEGAIDRHPLRERLRMQLMLALYRAGRQAEALQVFRDTRRYLVDELGLEPSQEMQGLEQAILRQDPSLDLLLEPSPAGGEPTGAAAVPAAHPRPWLARHRTAAIGASVLVAAGAVAAVALIDSEPTSARPNSVAVLDPESGSVLESVPVGSHPTTVAVGAGAVWALNADDQTLSRIDPDTHAVKTFATGSRPGDLAVSGDAVWVAATPSTRPLPVSTILLKVDPASGVVAHTTRLPRREEVALSFGATAGGNSVAVGEGSVWTVNPDSTVSRVSPATGAVVATIPTLAANTVAVGEEGVWVSTLEGELARIDPETDRVAETIPIASSSLNSVAVGAGAVWASDPVGGSVWRVDLGDPRVVMRTIPVGSGVTGVTFGEGAAWAINGPEETVTRIDPATNETERLQIGATPLGIATGEGAVWVASGSSGTEVPTANAGVAGAVCDDVYYSPGGPPDELIVSDMPLQGRSRTQTLSIAQAIRQVLEERDFHAGEYTVGYQSCDDSTAQAQDFEFERCASNARAYIASDVVGVIGAYNSDCTIEQLPVVNEADDPLAMVSPSNSYAGLTLGGPSHPPGELDRLYPDGERNYVRVLPADDAQAQGMAAFAASRGVRRAFLIGDESGGGYAIDIVHYFRAAAERLGISIAGTDTWNARADGYERLARSVAESRADAVVLAGAIDSNGGRLIRDLRAALGSRVLLLGSDGFTRGKEVLAAAGQVAEGMFAAVPGTPPEQLGPAGRRFSRRFKEERPPWLTPDYYWAPYGAQATEVMLDAIAASDGSRASVIEHLAETRIEDGILGDVRFDEHGDVTPGAIAILRVTRGGEGFTRLGPDFAEGTVVEKVIRIP